MADNYKSYVEFTHLKEAQEDKFPAVYHNLIHSPQLNTLLQVEQTYAIAIKDSLKSKEIALDNLQKRYIYTHIHVLNYYSFCVSKTPYLCVYAYECKFKLNVETESTL